MKKKIVIVSGVPLVQNPRVVKEADLLTDCGFDVHVLSAIYDKNQIASTSARIRGRKWTVHFVLNAAGNPLDFFQWQFARIRRKFLRSFAGNCRAIFMAELYGSISALKKKAISLRGDFYSLHNEPSMFVADELQKRNIPYGFDLEDWHSENNVYGVSAIAYDLLRDQERKVFSSASFVTTTSNVLAHTIALEYGIPLPSTVFNSFPDSDFVDAVSSEKQKAPLTICWFSQTIGHGRGLELLANALKLLDIPIVVSLRGHVSNEFRESLKTQFRARNVKLNFWPLCLHEQLNAWLSTHHLGFASEIPHCRNRDLTITNKILQYMQAGLMVIATNTKGQLEVAGDRNGGVWPVAHDSAEELASCILNANSSKNLAYEQGFLARKSFVARYDWEISRDVLARLYERNIPLAN